MVPDLRPVREHWWSYLHIVIFTKIGGFQVEVHKVKLDPEPLRDSNIPSHFGVTWIGIWIARGLDLAEHFIELHGMGRNLQQGKAQSMVEKEQPERHE